MRCTRSVSRTAPRCVVSSLTWPRCPSPTRAVGRRLRQLAGSCARARAQRRREPPVTNPLDAWVRELSEALGVDPASTDVALLLDVARDAAHGVARPAAPLTTFLVGLAAGQRGGGADAVAQAAARRSPAWWASGLSRRPTPARRRRSAAHRAPGRRAAGRTSRARSTARLDGADTATMPATPAATAFCTISNETRPLTTSRRSAAGNRPSSSARPITLSTALCRPTSSRTAMRSPAAVGERGRVDATGAVEGTLLAAHHLG